MKLLRLSAILLSITLSLACTGHSSVEAKEEIGVILDYEKQDYDQPPILVDGTTLVPMRGIFEDLGAEVIWDAANQKITATKRKMTVELQIGSQSAKVNNIDVTLAQSPQIVNGRTLVPLRVVSEALGAEVDWDGESRIVTIRSAEQRLKSSVVHGDGRTFEFLMNHGSIDFVEQANSRYLLFEAAYVGADHPIMNDMLRAMLKVGADPNLQPPYENTPLMAAIMSGNEEGVKILLEAKADIRLKDQDGHNALWLAAAYERDSIVNLLRQAGDTDTWTPDLSTAQTEDEQIRILHYYAMTSVLADGSDPDLGALVQFNFVGEHFRDAFMNLSDLGKKKFVVDYVQENWGNLPRSLTWSVLVTGLEQWLIGAEVSYGMKPEDVKLIDIMNGDQQ